MTTPTPAPRTDRPSPVRETAKRVTAIVVLMVVIGLLASTYIGHAKGPYGVCYGQSGRSIPCVLVTRASGK